MKTIVAEVRYAETGDAAELSAVHDAAWQSTYGGLIPYKALGRMIERRNPAWWERAVRNRSAILVVEFDGVTAGYATLGQNRTGALAVEGEIYELYIRPEFQGAGFGRLLFEAARALLSARGLRGLAVWALEDNTRALDFYKALGGVDIAAGEETFDGVTLGKVAFIWA